jgi:hypothetical protein
MTQGYMGVDVVEAVESVEAEPANRKPNAN